MESNENQMSVEDIVLGPTDDSSELPAELLLDPLNLAFEPHPLVFQEQVPQGAAYRNLSLGDGDRALEPSELVPDPLDLPLINVPSPTDVQEEESEVKVVEMDQSLDINKKILMTLFIFIISIFILISFLALSFLAFYMLTEWFNN